MWKKKLEIVQPWDQNKALEHDGVSKRMFSQSSPFILKPLSLILRNYLNSCTFPDEWKKANIGPLHKRNMKQLANKHRHGAGIHTLKIFWKAYFWLWKRITSNNNHWSCRPNDFCINQLTSTSHSIFCAFNADPSLEVCGVFLDLSKHLIKFGTLV